MRQHWAEHGFGLFAAELPEASAVLRLERALVAEVVRGGGGVLS